MNDNESHISNPMNMIMAVLNGNYSVYVTETIKGSLLLVTTISPALMTVPVMLWSPNICQIMITEVNKLVPQW